MRLSVSEHTALRPMRTIYLLRQVTTVRPTL